MTQQFSLSPTDYASRAISPLLEMGAYEAIWLDEKSTFKTVADKFRENIGAVPSDFVMAERALECATRVTAIFRSNGIEKFGVRVHGAGEYPMKLRDARHPVELLYYQGWWDLVDSPSVAVVGTRKPSADGAKRAERLARLLVEDGYTVVSGLAAGIDSIAHQTAISSKGRTIAVIGTPLSAVYPKTNADLQKFIADNFLVVSQVPCLRYMQAKNPTANSYFFPERNKTMSALTLATIVVEAGETSGTLYQARAALDQGRKLFILDSCFTKGLAWPAKFEALGGIRVKDYSDIRKHLDFPCTSDSL